MAGFIFAWLVFATFLLSERLAKDNRKKKRLHRSTHQRSCSHAILMRFSNCLEWRKINRFKIHSASILGLKRAWTPLKFLGTFHRLQSNPASALRLIYLSRYFSANEIFLSSLQESPN